MTAFLEVCHHQKQKSVCLKGYYVGSEGRKGDQNFPASAQTHTHTHTHTHTQAPPIFGVPAAGHGEN